MYDLLDYGREGQRSQAPAPAPVNRPLPCSSLSPIPCGFAYVCAPF